MNWLRRLIEYLLRLFGFGRTKQFRVQLKFDTLSSRAMRFMGFDFHKLETTMSLDVVLGDTGTHTAVLTATNLDGTHAEGVTVAYASDNPAAVSVDEITGALTIVAVGTANITGTGTRGAFTHSDSGSVTVAQSDDFTATLSLT